MDKQTLCACFGQVAKFVPKYIVPIAVFASCLWDAEFKGAAPKGFNATGIDVAQNELGTGAKDPHCDFARTWIEVGAFRKDLPVTRGAERHGFLCMREKVEHTEVPLPRMR